MVRGLHDQAAGAVGAGERVAVEDPGAIIQLIGGSRRQLGIMLATGLLITTPMAGWMVAAGLAVRVLAPRFLGRKAKENLEIFAGGAIAGDALYSFGNGVWTATK
ncbi:hypothetical protein ACFV9W_33380 [Streptomyces sp. NPDC059897]|uniref:hypothetical protein n=1 Tax=Streptomyces sp. NPDC059897 TaxID=3346994 RepID=UPI00366A2FD6